MSSPISTQFKRRKKNNSSDEDTPPPAKRQISTQLKRKKEYNDSDEEDPTLAIQQTGSQLKKRKEDNSSHDEDPSSTIQQAIQQTTPPSTGVSVPPDDTDSSDTMEEDSTSEKSPNELLWLAAEDGDINGMRSARGERAVLEWRNPYHVDMTALHIAAFEGRSEAVALLLEWGSSVHVVDRNGRSPLHRAKNLQVAQMLLRHGASVDIIDEDGNTCLHNSSEFATADTVALFISKRLDINATNNAGMTPMHLAANNNKEAVSLLLKEGARVDIIDIYGHSPLHFAMDVQVAQMLLRHGASVDVVDKNGRSPLHYARDAQVAQMLLRHGASVDIIDKDGNTCLHTSSEFATADAVAFFISKGADINATNNDGVTPLHILQRDALKDGKYYAGNVNKQRQECLLMLKNDFNIDIPEDSKASEPDSTTVTNEDTDASTSHGPDTHSVTNEDVRIVAKRIKQRATGEIRVVGFILHGAPGAGKTCVRGLILNLPPQYYRSTRLMEDPVRAISTFKLVSFTNGSSESTGDALLKEIDEEEIIQMILVEALTMNKLEEEGTNEKPKQVSSSISTTIVDRTSHDGNSAPHHRNPSTSVKPQPEHSEVLRQIAAAYAVNQMKPGMSPLFQCRHVNIVDTGGQSQFANLLPLVLQSAHSRNHLVVIRLDEKLNDRPKNRFNKYDLPEHLTLTNYQLIERVCQLASGSKAHVVIVGTCLDLENKEEPLEKKMKLLEPLMKKYPHNLALTKERKPIFAVNAMEPEGEERKKYATTLQEVILKAPTLDESGNQQGNGGILVPLIWFVLELELSLRSKDKAGVLGMEKIRSIAQMLEVSDLDEALAFFTKLAFHYHYPEALPNKIFTSITPIASQLSSIVEASFPCESGPICPDQQRLQTTGELTRVFLDKLCSQLPFDEHFSSKEFLHLMKYLRVLFDIDEDTFLLPSLLPVDTQQPLDDYYHEPLLCYWNESKQVVCILPQSYFHALINELLRDDKVELDRNRQNSRSTFHFRITAPSNSDCQLVLIDCVSWLEVFVDDGMEREECVWLLDMIQLCTLRILDQLDLTKLKKLQYGLRCYSEKCKANPPHLSKCMNRSCFTFTCFENGNRWNPEMDKEDKRLFLFTVLTKTQERIISEVELNTVPIDCTTKVNETKLDSTDRSASTDTSDDNVDQGDVTVAPAPDTDHTVLPSNRVTILSVSEATVDITDWGYLALFLGISDTDLQHIKTDHKDSLRQRHKAIVTKWLDSGNASWATLVSALRKQLVGKGALADTIAKQHPNKEAKRKTKKTKNN